MLIKDVMSRPPIVISPRNSAYDALALMKERKIRRLPVIEEERLVGIVTDRDIRSAKISSLANLPKYAWNEALREIEVRKIMTQEAVTVSPDDSIECAAILMRRHKIGGMPVVEEGRVIGVITESDIFRVFSTIFGAEPGYFRVVLENTEISRAAVPRILDRFPGKIQTVLFSPESPEIVLVFKAPQGKLDSQPILKELQKYPFPILDYDLFEPVTVPLTV